MCIPCLFSPSAMVHLFIHWVIYVPYAIFLPFSPSYILLSYFLLPRLAVARHLLIQMLTTRRQTSCRPVNKTNSLWKYVIKVHEFRYYHYSCSYYHYCKGASHSLLSPFISPPASHSLALPAISPPGQHFLRPLSFFLYVYVNLSLFTVQFWFFWVISVCLPFDPVLLSTIHLYKHRFVILLWVWGSVFSF